MSYSVILGKAYKEAQTEYGLVLAKKVLEAMKKHISQYQVTEDEIWSIIQKGDRNFARCSKDKSINPNEDLSEKFISNLVAHDIPHDDGELIETNFYDDDEGPGYDELQVPDTYSISAEGIKNVDPSDYRYGSWQCQC